MKTTSNMYESAKTWNPFKGCRYDCSYCIPSFQAQAKRQMHNCGKCYNYTPHTHPERLGKIPNSDIVFVCGNSDIAFCPQEFLRLIIEAIKKRNLRSRKPQTFYLQSKKPDCLKPFLGMLPENVILVTTLETNHDEGYDVVSKAPMPSVRFKQFLELEYPRKVVTIEPVLDFDVDEFAERILRIKPEYVWLGLNSRSARLNLPEPSPEKLRKFTTILIKNGIPIKGKDLREIDLPGVKVNQGGKKLPGGADADQGHGGGKSGKPSVAELEAWANEQRRAYREGRLAQRKIRLLNEIGFNWVEDANRNESLVRDDKDARQ